MISSRALLRTTATTTTSLFRRKDRRSCLMIHHFRRRRRKSSFALATAIVAASSSRYKIRNHNNNNASSCLAAAAATADIPIEKEMTRWQRIRYKARKALRMFARIVKLWIALTPLLFLYPLLRNNSNSNADNDDTTTTTTATTQQQQQQEEESEKKSLPWFTRWYLQFCLKNVEWSGAAVIKLMQWLSSRPDLVGDDFCRIFGKLQDSTTPHPWSDTVRAMEEAFGENWETDVIELEKEPIGSGCIGQVYKGRLWKKSKKKTKMMKQQQQQQNDDNDNDSNDYDVVAVKVLHPGIEQNIDVDLDLLRVLAKALPCLYQPVSWLNPGGAVEEFGRMLTSQLDLRQEARNIAKFQQNFQSEEGVLFPTVHAAPTKRVLVESYIKGRPILEYAADHRNDHELLHQLCMAGIRIVCKMIFVYNHCHGDLHPGNIFITEDGQNMALLDCGIVNTYSPDDHAHIVNVLTSFIRHDGQQAGRLLMENSSHRTRGDGYDPEGFVSKIDHLAQRAADPNEHLMEHLGTYITIICNAAAHHRVLMNQSFVSAALAVKVQEGIVLALDPALEIWRVANPIILEGEAIRHTNKLLKRFTTTTSREEEEDDNDNNNNNNKSSSLFPWNLFATKDTTATTTTVP